VGVGYLLEMGVPESWLNLVKKFEEILKERMRDNLVRIIARSSPDDLVYESNVLVVVKKADISTIRKVSRAAIDAMEATGIEGISPMTVEEGDRAEEAFFSKSGRKIDPESWLNLVKKFEEILRERIKDNLVRVIARSSPDDLVYESNVLVVVRKADLDTIREVSRSAIDAMEITGLEGISPMTVTEGDTLEKIFLSGGSDFISK